ncbi:hypothetical protein FUAX_51960 (plasmid) [Fulvitalea axinellae]|uniref:Glycoside hydrolase family 19 catalytic domain-containing protein n=1 Tax=Fulvitalea axinellae TaxID=1182444 RepID=A0AAU9CLA3_9BACT|nr:hypothetical protein FUAX_51960 [Fulvitalea axinellae]
MRKIRDSRLWGGLSSLLFAMVVMMACDSDGGTDTETPPPAKPDPTDPVEPTPPDDEDDNGNGSSSIAELVSLEQYYELFPFRCGSEGAQSEGANQCGNEDFYTYENFLKAAEAMAGIKVRIEQRDATYYIPPRIYRIDKNTGEEKLVSDPPEFNDEWVQTLPIVSTVVDYATFAAEGSDADRRRELAAFFANIAQETTGGWATAPGGKYAWGLFYKEELGYYGSSHVGYAVPHKQYPPTEGKSYHGRGPIQLSYNYNYGQVSEYLFGDKSVMLDNPERVSEDGAFAFQTAIWFWMTPQFPKPSCHQAMIPGIWTPSSADQSVGRKQGFALTIAIINGGVECGGPNEKAQGRFKHFEVFAKALNTSTGLDGGDDTDLDCRNIQPY